jgi:hypothetical protein
MRAMRKALFPRNSQCRTGPESRRKSSRTASPLQVIQHPRQDLVRYLALHVSDAHPSKYCVEVSNTLTRRGRAFGSKRSMKSGVLLGSIEARATGSTPPSRTCGDSAAALPWPTAPQCKAPARQYRSLEQPLIQPLFRCKVADRKLGPSNVLSLITRLVDGITPLSCLIRDKRQTRTARADRNRGASFAFNTGDCSAVVI